MSHIITRNQANLSLTLTKQEGDCIREIIESKVLDVPTYFRSKCNLHPTNVYSILAGKKVCTLKFLKKLLEPLGLQPQMKLTCEIVACPIKSDAQPVNSTPNDIPSPSGEQDTSDPPPTDPFGSFEGEPPTFSSLEKPQEK